VDKELDTLVQRFDAMETSKNLYQGVSVYERCSVFVCVYVCAPTLFRRSVRYNPCTYVNVCGICVFCVYSA